MYAVKIDYMDARGFTRTLVQKETWSRPVVFVADTQVTVYEAGQVKHIVRNWSRISYDDSYQEPEVEQGDSASETPKKPDPEADRIPF